MLILVGVAIFITAFIVTFIGALVIRNAKVFAIGFAAFSAITLLDLWGVVDGVYSTTCRLADRVIGSIGGAFLTHPALFIVGGVVGWFGLLAVVGMNADRIRAWADQKQWELGQSDRPVDLPTVVENA